MKSDARWMTILAWRVLTNAVIGGVFFAAVGVFCIGLAFGYLGTVADYSGVSGANGSGGFEGAFLGAKTGVLSGIAGVILFAIITIRAVPGPLLEPFNAFIVRVILGQALGTASISTAFFMFEIVKATLKGQALILNMIEDQSWIIYGAPILMIFGAIAAALTKRTAPQSATLNAE